MDKQRNSINDENNNTDNQGEQSPFFSTQNIIGLASTIAVVGIAIGAFSRSSVHQIRERARGHTQASERSELSLAFNRPMECSHLDHSRTNPNYDSPENGLLVTDIEHLAYHMLYAESPRLIGLNIHQNNRAITGILGRVRQNNVNMKWDMKESDLMAEIDKAKKKWIEKLGIEA